MQKILLVSTTFIKNISNISDNISGKLLEPAIYEAQNNGLRSVLGDRLVDKLEQLVADNQVNLPENAEYKNLLDKCQYFLAYTAISDVIMLTAVKIDNAGAEQVGDEHMTPLDITETYRLRDFYIHKADYLCRQLQNYVLQNKSSYPELSTSDLHSIKSNLLSAASTGIWLGGPRCPNRYRRIRRY